MGQRRLDGKKIKGSNLGGREEGRRKEREKGAVRDIEGCQVKKIEGETDRKGQKQRRDASVCAVCVCVCV